LATRALLLGLTLCLLTAGTASAAQSLPDLEQQVPKNVGVTSSAPFQLFFDSQVINRGSGPLEIRGHKDTDATVDMPAVQWVLTDGTMQSVGQVGTLHYETSFDHQHFHFQPFDHYELRKLDGTLVVKDVKQGFCLGDNDSPGNGTSPHYGATWCSVGHPEVHDLTEGLSPGWGDTYEGNLEGQDIPISQSTVPAGDYNLVHRVNENTDGSPGPVHETSFGNNVASAWITISWSGGKPSVKTKKTCKATAQCGTPPPPPAPPSPPPPTPKPTPPPPGGGTTTTTPVATPGVTTDTIAPKLVFASGTTERFKARSTALWVVAGCDEQCSLAAQGTVSFLGSAKVLRTGKTTLKLPAGSRTKVVLSLSRSLRRAIRHALAHHKRVRVRVTLTVVDSSGNSATSTRTLKLVR
jgi:hypothetical protein